MAKQTIDVPFHFNCHIVELLDDVKYRIVRSFRFGRMRILLRAAPSFCAALSIPESAHALTYTLSRFRLHCFFFILFSFFTVFLFYAFFPFRLVYGAPNYFFRSPFFLPFSPLIPSPSPLERLGTRPVCLLSGPQAPPSRAFKGRLVELLSSRLPPVTDDSLAVRYPLWSLTSSDRNAREWTLKNCLVLFSFLAASLLLRLASRRSQRGTAAAVYE